MSQRGPLFAAGTYAQDEAIAEVRRYLVRLAGAFVDQPERDQGPEERVVDHAGAPPAYAKMEAVSAG